MLGSRGFEMLHYSSTRVVDLADLFDSVFFSDPCYLMF